MADGLYPREKELNYIDERLLFHGHCAVDRGPEGRTGHIFSNKDGGWTSCEGVETGAL